MQIVTKRGDVTVYSQVLDDSKTLNNTVAALMQQPTGDQFVTTITNNGHDLVFRNSSFDRDRVIRAVNGIVSKARKGAS